MDIEGIIAITGFFTTVIVIVIGLPLVKAHIRAKERHPALGAPERERDARLARMENAIEAVALEVERIAEGQRFVTRLLAERHAPATPPAERERPGGVLPPSQT